MPLIGAPQQCEFIDPRGSVATYTWQVNPPYDGVAAAQKVRQVERTSNTGNVGATKQQGDDGPLILHWEPLVYHEAQQIAMWQWYVLCRNQTIYLVDWNGWTYEGQITTLGEQWVGAIGGPGDTRQRIGYAKMVMEFEVYRFVSGPMAAAGVTP